MEGFLLPDSPVESFDLFSAQKASCQISLGFIADIIINSVLYLLSGHQYAFSVMSFHSQSWQLSIHEGMPELKYPASLKKDVSNFRGSFWDFMIVERECL